MANPMHLLADITDVIDKYRDKLSKEDFLQTLLGLTLGMYCREKYTLEQVKAEIERVWPLATITIEQTEKVEQGDS